jgi:starvation-inducible DNA-binding protein
MTNILQMKPDIETLDTGLEADKRKKLAGKLSKTLADTMLLQIKTQVYHWNVVGPLFKPIHELTEEHYRDLFAAVDEIAERIRALGYPAPQSFADLIPKTDLDEESAIRSALEMVEQLVKDHENIVRGLRESARDAEEMGDFATHDLLTGRLSFHEKAIWMLRATVAD